MQIITGKKFFYSLIVAGILLPASFDSDAKDWKAPTMTALTPRLQTMFEKTKALCFGRFMVDVPASSTVAWGRSIVGMTVVVYPDRVGEVRSEAQRFIEELKSEKAINQDNISLLISIDDVRQPEGQIVVGYEDFEAIRGLAIKGYFILNNSGVIIEARPLKDKKDKVVSDIAEIARRLRLRNEIEAPVEPGNCIEYGFLPDKAEMSGEYPKVLLEIGFRLKEFPDTNISIAIRPAQQKFNESNTLEWQLTRLESDLKAEDSNHIRLKTRYLRRGKRTIQNWGEGFEALARSPEQPEIHSIHDFGMDFQGVANDPLKPFINIQMQTGIADNEAGAAKPLLTDEEAVAVWDKITSTIRIRPTGSTAVKSSATETPPEFALGELAVTGRTCPQSGMWESSEAPRMNGVQRRYLKAGEIMPRVTVRGEPSLWQKFNGQTPTHQLATIWKLVGYDDVSTLANTVAATPSIVQALPETSAIEKAETNIASDDSRSAEASRKDKG